MSSPTNSLKQILASICCCRNIDGIDAHDGAPPSNRNEDNQVGSSSQSQDITFSDICTLISTI